jgi:hypothetical protein
MTCCFPHRQFITLKFVCFCIKQFQCRLQHTSYSLLIFDFCNLKCFHFSDQINFQKFIWFHRFSSFLILNRQSNLTSLPLSSMRSLKRKSLPAFSLLIAKKETESFRVSPRYFHRPQNCLHLLFPVVSFWKGKAENSSDVKQRWILVWRAWNWRVKIQFLKSAFQNGGILNFRIISNYIIFRSLEFFYLSPFHPCLRLSELSRTNAPKTWKVKNKKKKVFSTVQSMEHSKQSTTLLTLKFHLARSHIHSF